MAKIKLTEAQLNKIVKSAVNRYLKENEENKYPFQLHTFEFEAYCPSYEHRGDDVSVTVYFSIYAPDEKSATEIAENLGFDRVESRFGDVDYIVFHKYEEDDYDSTEEFFDEFFDENSTLYDNLYKLNDYRWDCDASYHDNGPDTDYAYDSWKDNQ